MCCTVANLQYVVVCCNATEAIRKNQATAKASNIDIEMHIKEWFKFAAELDGGKRSRDLKKKATVAASVVGAAIAE